MQDNPTPSYGNPFLGALRFAAFVTMTLTMVPVYMLYKIIRPDDRFFIPQHFNRLLLNLLGFQLRVHGAMAATKPVLFVANHSSYLDIPVLGALLPAIFVAKAEVADWPIFGFLAKIQNTVFVERRAARVGSQRQHINEMLSAGHSLILFPEGTSSDGHGVLPFKSALFSAIESVRTDIGLSIQPISVACTELDGLPITRALRPFYAWYGDMTLMGHLWNVFRMGRFTVDVIFHPAISWEHFRDRKALAAYCQQQVASGIERCVTGRHMGGSPFQVKHVTSGTG